jgi:hypothetical protein
MAESTTANAEMSIRLSPGMTMKTPSVYCIRTQGRQKLSSFETANLNQS